MQEKQIKNDTYQLFLGDALELIQKIPDQSVDLIVTDPPYESLRRWEGVGTTARMGLGKRGSKAHDEEKFFMTIPNSCFPFLLKEFYRVLKPNTHCYLMCDAFTLPYIYWANGFSAENPKSKTIFQNIKPLVWDKVYPGMGYHYRARYEFIVLLDKGKPKLNDLSISDILAVPRLAGKNKKVPTQKPTDLMEILIRQSSCEGATVLDPFAGSGSTGVAALRTGRRFLGFELDAEHFEIANNALKAMQLPIFADDINS